MSDRTARARAEAERQIHVYGDDFKARTLRANLNDAFVQGVEWADANHPRAEALARVREMHGPSEYGCASECRDDDGGLSWPCATYQATEVDG